MSQPGLSTPGPVLSQGRKPKTSIYIVLLIVALVALLIGCVLLLMEIKRHGGFGAVRGSISAASPLSVSPIAATAAFRPLTA